MRLTRLNPPALPQTQAFGYSQATVAAGVTQTIYISGQIGITARGPNNFRAQLECAFENLTTVLTAQGMGPSDVARITLLVVDHDPEKLAQIAAKRLSYFGETLPASTLIPVPCLALPEMLFELDAVAIKGAGE